MQVSKSEPTLLRSTPEKVVKSLSQDRSLIKFPSVENLRNTIREYTGQTPREEDAELKANQYIRQVKKDILYQRRKRDVLSKKRPNTEIGYQFPKWITQRRDFQNFFVRYAVNGQDKKQSILNALTKLHTERSKNDITTLAAWLKNFKPFQNISHTQASFVSKWLKLEKFNQGDVIVKQGNEGTCFYMILSGSVEVLVDSERVEVLNEGQYFGEASLVGNTSRAATIRAIGLGTTKLGSLRAFHYREAVKLSQHHHLTEAQSYFKTHPITTNWSKNKLLQLITSTRKRNFAVGEIMQTEGEPTDCFYFIIEGECIAQKNIKVVNENRLPTGMQKNSYEIRRRVKNRTIKLSELKGHENDFFGEDGVLGLKHQTYSIHAITPVSTYVIFKQEAMRLLSSKDAVTHIRTKHDWRLEDSSQVGKRFFMKEEIDANIAMLKESAFGPSYRRKKLNLLH
eukprot:g3043.t1